MPGIAKMFAVKQKHSKRIAKKHGDAWFLRCFLAEQKFWAARNKLDFLVKLLFVKGPKNFVMCFGVSTHCGC